MKWLPKLNSFTLIISLGLSIVVPLIHAFSTQTSTNPTLVVGATGKVGRLVVKQLLEQQKPVRALVRDEQKAKEIFQSSDKNLEIVVCDLGKCEEDSNQQSILRDAIQGVDAIISVSGTMRFSKITDFFPPWKIFQEDVSSWCDDTSHPWFINYKAQCFMIDEASKQEKIPKFVRLTGLSTGFSTFNLFTLIFSSLLSLSSRYHYLCEEYLRGQDKVPYVILRPGGLGEEERDTSQTYIQVEPSGYLPPPGRIPRADVAALAVQACDESIVPQNSRYTLGVQAVGEMKPKSQGDMENGFATVKECLVNVVETTPSEGVSTEIKRKPYGIAVISFVYSFAVVALGSFTKLIQFVGNLFS